ncbi:hypothetical protein G7Y89_g2677 [Cudoniella acicularis]|uniref:Uncharacterized protein n=1 Tax=Cudoniella acicularis TaxID=354080 RepID=A0A8H4RUN2_9HELO|nr:hypothetical protein G7Y89_g2677 [Cudoniella acicularis]
MAPPLPKKVVEAIELAIDIAHKNNKIPNMNAIAESFNTTYSTVTYIRRRVLKIQKMSFDYRQPSDPKPLKNQDKIAEAIRDLLQRRPEFDQTQVHEYICAVFGIKCAHQLFQTLSKITKFLTNGRISCVEEPNSSPQSRMAKS